TAGRMGFARVGLLDDERWLRLLRKEGIGSVRDAPAVPLHRPETVPTGPRSSTRRDARSGLPRLPESEDPEWDAVPPRRRAQAIHAAVLLLNDRVHDPVRHHDHRGFDS